MSSRSRPPRKPLSSDPPTAPTRPTNPSDGGNIIPGQPPPKPKDSPTDTTRPKPGSNETTPSVPGQNQNTNRVAAVAGLGGLAAGVVSLVKVITGGVLANDALESLQEILENPIVWVAIGGAVYYVVVK